PRPGHAQAGGDRSGDRPGESAIALAEQLASAFREQRQRALGVELRDEDGARALAYVAHCLALRRDETLEPIVWRGAADAGAWFGELIRRGIGGTWSGDGVDPRRLRLLLEPQFVHFSPVDMASEAILSGSLSSSDRRSRP